MKSKTQIQTQPPLRLPPMQSSPQPSAANHQLNYRPYKEASLLETTTNGGS